MCLYIYYIDIILYIYNSVCTRRHKHINSSVSAPLNATKIDVMKGTIIAKGGLSIYKCCFLAFCCARWLNKSGSSSVI